MKFVKTFAVLATGLALALSHTTNAIAKTDLLVYTAVEADELKKFKKVLGFLVVTSSKNYESKKNLWIETWTTTNIK